MLSFLRRLTIGSNETYVANFVWIVNGTIQLGFEVDYRQTDYVALASGDGVVLMREFL